MSIFEQASRLKLRFATTRGELATEDLWSLPLTSDSRVNLDALARAVNRQIRERNADDESFVAPVRKASDTLDLQLNILKHVISVRLAENQAKTARAARTEERAALQALLTKKQGEALDALSEDEVKARLAALDSAESA